MFGDGINSSATEQGQSAQGYLQGYQGVHQYPCPHCGYCPHCGRSNQPQRPYLGDPWPPNWPTITCNGVQGGSAL